MLEQGSTKKKILFAGFMFVLSIALLEGAARVLLAVVAPRIGIDDRSTRAILAEQSQRVRALLTETHREVIDSTLGWRYRPGYRNGTDAVTTQGLRGDRLYDSLPPDGVLRLAAFGDSFVYGNEVGNADNWTAIVEQEAPLIEVLNFGVGGYGVDQAYLRYLAEGERFRSHVVAMGFIPDDLRRLVNVYRRFIDSRELALSKPRYVLDGDRLTLIPNPLPTPAAYERLLANPASVKRLGEFDHWYDAAVYENPVYDVSGAARLAVAVWSHIHDRYVDSDRLYVGQEMNENSEAFRIQMVLFEQFLATARERGTEPLILLFPDRLSLERLGAGGTTVYARLARQLTARGAPIVDLADAFATVTDEAIDAWFMPGGHYSRRGNEIVARHVRARLESYRTGLPGIAAQ